MSKEKEKYIIQMVIFIKENIICLKNMVKVFIFGVHHKVAKQEPQDMKVNLKRIIFKDKLEYILLRKNTILEE
jgi:hypothetical protein